MENSRRCKICKIDFHRASYAKHIKSRKNSENKMQDELINQNGYLKKSKHIIGKKEKRYITLNH